MIGIDAEYNQAAKLMSTVPAAARVLIADDQGDVVMISVRNTMCFVNDLKTVYR